MLAGEARNDRLGPALAPTEDRPAPSGVRAWQGVLEHFRSALRRGPVCLLKRGFFIFGRARGVVVLLQALVIVPCDHPFGMEAPADPPWPGLLANRLKLWVRLWGIPKRLIAMNAAVMVPSHHRSA
jgi:hypothetical protein